MLLENLHNLRGKAREDSASAMENVLNQIIESKETAEKVFSRGTFMTLFK